MRLLRALSLDVVAGAACGGLLAEDVTGARMLPQWWIALLCAVWCIYTADHLLDALRSLNPHATPRHEFHQRHAKGLSVALGLATVVALFASIALRPEVKALGFLLGILVGLYLASAQGLLLSAVPKEAPAALLYAAGIWGGPLITTGWPSAWVVAAFGFHALAALLNLAAMGVFETEIDRRLGSRSLSLLLGPIRTRRLIVGFAAFFGITAVVLALAGPRNLSIAFGVLGVQVATPALLLRLAGWFSQSERYRAWGDAVFILGALPRLLH